MELSKQSSGDFQASVVVYTGPWRVLAGVLRTAAHGSLVVLLGVFFFDPDAFPTNPLKQIRLFSSLFLAPEFAAWLLARAFSARAVVSNGMLTIDQRERSIEIPLDAIVGVEPWKLPAPRSGVSLRLRSGRLLPQGLATADAVGLVEAMVAGGASESSRDGLQSFAARYACARLANPATWLENPIVKFVVYSLVPTVPAFRLNQWIVYGGTFGEYYTYGLKAYLLGFALWWASWTFCVVLLAAGLRLVVEVVTIFFAALLPGSAASARRVAEWSQRLLYYGGIPTVLMLRFMQ